LRAYLEELLGGDDESRVANNGLKNNGSNFILVLLQELLNRLEVVVLGSEGASSGALGNAGGI